jgi:proline iminopeptidase
MIKRLIGGYVPPYKDKQGNQVPYSISTLEKVKLGGVDQWITIRGRHKELPILLFLHGGPGSPQTGAQQKYNSELEDHFLVVNWDQRGSGKSFSSEVTVESMNLEQMLGDAHELIQYLLEKFQQPKMFIMGQSIGSLYGLMLAHRYPELLYAFVGVNPPINRSMEEKLSYEFALENAKKKGNKKAIGELEGIGFPTNGNYRNIDDMVIQRKWLTKFNGVAFKKNAAFINMHYLLSHHLTFKEKLTFMKGFGFSATNLWEELTSVNFFSSVPEIEVPVFFIAGRHDKIVFIDLVQQYVDTVKAPEKHLIILEESGHLALFEEPERFNDILINQVLPLYSKSQQERRPKNVI